jgi:peptide/nickel transport system substrate-binding protein
MSNGTRGCVAVVVIALVVLAVAGWYCLSHGCYVGTWGFGPRPTIPTSPTPPSSLSPEEHVASIAILDEPTSPGFFDGALGNSSGIALDAVRQNGLEADIITSADIEAGALSRYDLLILPDNAPSASAVEDVTEWWRGGRQIVATNGASAFLLYSGLLFPELEGAGAGASRDGYWDYSSTGSVVVERDSCLTSGYGVGEELASGEGGALLYVDKLPPGAHVLAVDLEQPDKAAVVVYRGEGTVFFLGADPGAAYLEGILRNLLNCQAEEERVVDEINEAIDAEGLDWEAGTTSVSGLTEAEEEALCGDTSDHTTLSDSDHQDIAGLPLRVDWRDHRGADWLTPIRNQGQCGSCVAHAALGAFEAMIRIASGDPSIRPDLSEQFLFFCGCGRCCDVGWQLRPAAESLLDRGVPEEDCRQYDVRNAACSDTCADGTDVADRVVKATAFRRLTSAREMKESLAENGPILAGMDVYQDFLRYRGGVYKHAWGGFRGGHAITIVGYDDEARYWVARNSWGTDWGERGYFRIAYGAGIYDYAYELEAAPTATTPGPLVIGTVGAIDTLDPADAWSFAEWEILGNVMDTLVVYAPGSTDIEPGLAESWDVSEDGFEYTFHLRKGLEFPDGTPFTSEAVVWSIERTMELGGWAAHLVTDLVDRVRAMDDHTVLFVLKEPDGGFLSALTTPPYAPVSPNCFPEHELDAESTCGGIGHYSVGDWTFGSDIELVANDEYYGGLAESPRVIVRYYGDSADLRQALEDGEVDVAWDRQNPGAFADLFGDPGFDIFYGPGSDIRILGFNTTTSPFDDPLVRQAIELAVDRQLIADSVFSGVHWPLFTLVPEGVASHSDDSRPFDLEEARSLLEAAGYGPGRPLEMELWWTVDHYGATEAGLAEMLEDSLEGSGVIDVDLKATTWPAYADSFVSGQLPVFLLRWIPDYPDPDNFIWPLVSCEESGDMGISYCNGELEDLLRQARQTTDPDEREAVYYEIQDLLAEELPVIPLTQSSLLAVAQPGIDGVVLDASNLLRYWLIFKEFFGGAPAPAPPAAPAAPAAPQVTLENVEGRGAVVVDGPVTEISFDGLQKLAPQPGADGKTRIDIPPMFPDDAGEVVFKFTFGGKRYEARIGITYNPDSTVTYQLLGVTEVAEPEEEAAAEPTEEALPPATSTPVPPTPTPTRVAPTATPRSAAPAILSVEFPSNIRADGTDTPGTVRFRDPDGDVNYATFDVVRGLDFTGFGFDPTEFLVSGTASDGVFQFYLWSETVQQVTLEVTLLDAAGNRSAPVQFTFDCR